MAMTKEQILQEAMSLPAAERESLAEEIWFSLDGSTREEIDAAWMEEVKRRIEAVDRGEVTPVPVEEAIARILNRKPA